jgi:hypothetical protein
MPIAPNITHITENVTARPQNKDIHILNPEQKKEVIKKILNYKK